MSEEITFPDTPRSELEKTIEELVDRAKKVLTTQERLRSLLRANRIVVEELELSVVLRRIAEAAIELVDAQYGALGVIAADGGLEQFIHVGIPKDDVEAIGHLPEGHGLLGAVIDTGEPIRLEHLEDDPRSSGFPEHHPMMDGFLGVPIRVRSEIFGNLYLTNPRAGRFTVEDEELVSMLAATAGIAIENSRLFDDVTRRQRWSAALADVTSALLAGDQGDPLQILVDYVAELIDADLIVVATPVGTGSEQGGDLRVAAARGEGAGQFLGQVFPSQHSLSGEALNSGLPVLVEDQEASELFDGGPETGPTLVIPLSAFGHWIAAVSVARRVGGSKFTLAEVDMITRFSTQAGVAIEIARGRGDRQQLELAQDRARIARDLHDHVIQRLFATGLSLQSTAGRSADVVRDSILEQVDAIDTAISEIRAVVFALSSDHREPESSLRHRLLDIATELGTSLNSTPRLSFRGPVDLLVRDGLADDVAAVVRESLTNVVRHARATRTEIEVIIDDDHVSVRIDDDGIGYAPDVHVGGTKNLRERAANLGGLCTIGKHPNGGTRVLWSAPLGSNQ